MSCRNRLDRAVPDPIQRPINQRPSIAADLHRPQRPAIRRQHALAEDDAAAVAVIVVVVIAAAVGIGGGVITVAVTIAVIAIVIITAVAVGAVGKACADRGRGHIGISATESRAPIAAVEAAGGYHAGAAPTDRSR